MLFHDLDKKIRKHPIKKTIELKIIWRIMMNPALEENKDFLHVLIIGNGFDLAHGLETRYTDFLDLASHGLKTKDTNFLDADRSPSLWYKRFALMNRLEKIGVLKDKRGNWFNLEQEIYEFIRNPTLDKELIDKISANEKRFLNTPNDREQVKLYHYYEQVKLQSHYFTDPNSPLHTDNSQDMTTVVKALYERETLIPVYNNTVYGLRSFVDAFAVYLSQTVSDPIENLTQKPKFHFCLKELEEGNTNFQKHTLWVLNFNYTPTFQKLYEPPLTKRDINVHHCHIHGALGEGNLVLGCQSFDPADKINPAWNVFTKHHQRHRYGTIEKYQELIRELSHFKGEVAFHIIGHSLDEADHAILKHALCSSHNTAVQDSFISVYYHDEEAHLRLINNITTILGEEDVMARVRFIAQHDPKRGILKRVHETSKNQ